MIRYLLLLLPIVVCACRPAPEAPPRPNIVFAIADDATFRHFGAYGCTWVKTPNFDRVAREGVLFARAYTPNAKCAPSRACILTGRQSWLLEEAANHSPRFPAKFKTFAEALADTGYFVGHTAKAWAPGDPGEADGRRRQLIGPKFSEHQTEPPADHMSRNDYAANFGAFLDARTDGRPFFFWYGGTEPHRPYAFGAGVRHGKRLDAVDGIPPFWPDNDTVRTDLLDYAFEIEYFDHHLGRMLDTLAARGELDNTLVVVTADNGMPFPRVKGQTYELNHHLPLAMMWPAGVASPGRTVDDFVNFIDFAPTFLALAGTSPDAAALQPVQGVSLVPYLQDADSLPARDHVLIGKERHDVGRPHDQGYPARGIVTDEFLYVRNYAPDRWPAGNPETGYLGTDGGATKTWILDHRTDPANDHYWRLNFGKKPEEELYRIADDPACVDNLALDPEMQAIKARLRQRMEAQLLAEGDPRMRGEGHVFDEYPYYGEVRGFYERYTAGDTIETSWVNESDFEFAPPD
ncbi:MAG: sulfatase [Catalinimonas sp.]